MDAAQYLRKSRMEEGMETEEVLAKHRKALADFAARNNIHIIETYYEVVSGESLYARPEMLRLLRDVENGDYDAVLCMDLDRLSRGRMRDQGMIKKQKPPPMLAHQGRLIRAVIFDRANCPFCFIQNSLVFSHTVI